MASIHDDCYEWNYLHIQMQQVNFGLSHTYTPHGFDMFVFVLSVCYKKRTWYDQTCTYNKTKSYRDWYDLLWVTSVLFLGGWITFEHNSTCGESRIVLYFPEQKLWLDLPHLKSHFGSDHHKNKLHLTVVTKKQVQNKKISNLFNLMSLQTQITLLFRSSFVELTYWCKKLFVI